MTELYFFKNDGQCKFIKQQIDELIPRYLLQPVIIENKKTDLYIILPWIFSNKNKKNSEWLDDHGIKYVETIDELPEGAGIYLPVYDRIEVQEFEKRNIPVIKTICPWISQLRKQLLDVNTLTHQMILMIPKGNSTYKNFKPLFPDDIIIIDEKNYKDEISKKRNDKPAHLLVYTTFRKKDAERAVNFIAAHRPDNDHILDGYKKTLCGWVRQGLLEEIEETVHTKKLEEVWIICSSRNNRSTESIINEVIEQNALPVIITGKEDIPDCSRNIRAGVLMSPYPMPERIRKIVSDLKERFAQI